MTTTQKKQQTKRPQTARQLANHYRRLLDKTTDDPADDDRAVYDYLYLQLSLDATAKGLETVRSRVFYGMEHWDTSARERELLQAFLTETAPIFPLTWDDTVGCYAHDHEGNPWCTWMIAGALQGGAIPDEHKQPCAACGTRIASGWARGKLFEQTFYCVSHIRYSTSE